MGNSKDLISEVNSAGTSVIKASDTILSCTTTISNSACLLVDLLERIEEKAKELALREENVQAMEHEMAKSRNELEEVRTELDKKEKALNKRAELVLSLEGKWDETQRKMEENANKLPTLIQISVGGQRFVVPKATLLKQAGSYFESMLTSNHQQQVNGEFYIDHSPKHFQLVLDFLRNSNIGQFDGNVKELQKYFQFFMLPDPFSPVPKDTPVPEPEPKPELKPEPQPIPQENPPLVLPLDPQPEGEQIAAADLALFEGGDLLTPQLQLSFKDWLPNNTFSLLFKASRDGFSAKKFHESCDRKGPTLTIIQSKEGHLFGGYSSTPFSTSLFTTSSSHYYSETFLFTLSNPHNLPPTMYKHIPGTPGVNSSASTCVIFGEKVSLWGRVKHDIYLGNNANKHSGFINFPQCYEDTTGKGDRTFTGNYSFTVTDVEVFLVNAP